MGGSRAGFLWASALAFLRTLRSEIVEVSTVSNVEVTATGWDVRGAADGGCGVAGCDPLLTRDGLNNTVSDSRWSCTSDSTSSWDGDGCEIVFAFDDSFAVDHVVLYVHESNTALVSIPFEIVLGGSGSWGGGTSVSGLTSPGTPLGEGEQINIPDDSSSTSDVALDFTLTSGQSIGLSEVEIFVDVEDPGEYVIIPVDELYMVKATNVTNVVASADYWNLNADAGCGEAGCTPWLVTDGRDNTNSTSRWSCQVEDDYDDDYGTHRCYLTLTLDDIYTISYITVYVHESDDPDKTAMTFGLLTSGLNFVGTYQTTPGTPLGTGERFNLPRPLSYGLSFQFFNVTAGQVIAISEVEIYLEVTDTNVPITAKEAWTDVTAETLTTVTTVATGSLNGTSPEATRDGDDNTVAASRWSCDGGEFGYCVLFFEFNDEYTVSYLNLYMDGSDDAAQEPVQLDICTCETDTSLFYPDIYCSCVEGYEYSDPVGTYVTQPGTPLGEPERVNLLNPLASGIGIVCQNLTASGGTVSIGEVEIFFQVPDATPTPAPFIDETSLYSGSTTSYSPEATTSFSPEATTSPTLGTVTTSSSPEATSSSLSETTTGSPVATTTTSSPVETTSSSPPLESTTTSLEGEEDDERDTNSEYSAGDDDTPAGSIPSATPTPADGTNELDLLGSGGARIINDGPWVVITLSVTMFVLPTAF